MPHSFQCILVPAGLLHHGSGGEKLIVNDGKARQRSNLTTFLFGLGLVYAVHYRISTNVLVLWPLLTPLGSFFAQLESGELTGELPWAAIAGFADVVGLMAAIIWVRASGASGCPAVRSRRVPRAGSGCVPDQFASSPPAASRLGEDESFCIVEGRSRTSRQEGSFANVTGGRGERAG